eukprot:1145647-Pelagomonas_calceolata.AAC.3
MAFPQVPNKNLAKQKGNEGSEMLLMSAYPLRVASFMLTALQAQGHQPHSCCIEKVAGIVLHELEDLLYSRQDLKDHGILSGFHVLTAAEHSDVLRVLWEWSAASPGDIEAHAPGGWQLSF